MSLATSTVASLNDTTNVLTIQAGNVSSFPAINGFTIQIDAEKMQVVSGAGTATWTLLRAQNGTTEPGSPSHAVGAPITWVGTAGPLTGFLPLTGAGTYPVSTIPALDAAQITTGAFPKARQSAATAYTDAFNTFNPSDASAGSIIAPFKLAPDFSGQTGAAGWSALQINVAGAGGGNAAKDFLDFQISSVQQFAVDSAGNIKAAPNGALGTTTTIVWNGIRATIGYDGAGTYGTAQRLILQSGVGKALALQTNGATDRLTIGSSWGETVSAQAFGTQTAGSYVGFAQQPSITHGGGSAATFSALQVNATVSGTTTGTNYLLDLQLGGTRKATVDSTGLFTTRHLGSVVGSTTSTSGLTTGPAYVAGSYSVVNNDLYGTISITNGGAGTAGTFLTVPFQLAYTATPVVTLTPTNGAASGVQVYVTQTTTGFTINANQATTATTYTWNFHVAGV